MLRARFKPKKSRRWKQVPCTRPLPRQRRRAQALRGQQRGQSLTQLATFYAVRYATVHAWGKAWRNDGLVGLAQGAQWSPAAGARGNQKKVAAWLGTATQHLREPLPRLTDELAITLSISSLRRLARRLGYPWKHCRRSRKAPRNPPVFAAGQQQWRTLPQAEQRGEVAVCYADDCRFARQAPVPYAGQVRGQPAVELPAGRGRGGGAVLGCWQAGGGRQPGVASQRAGRFPADLFALAVDEWSPPDWPLGAGA